MPTQCHDMYVLFDWRKSWITIVFPLDMIEKVDQDGIVCFVDANICANDLVWVIACIILYAYDLSKL